MVIKGDTRTLDNGSHMWYFPNILESQNNQDYNRIMRGLESILRLAQLMKRSYPKPQP